MRDCKQHKPQFEHIHPHVHGSSSLQMGGGAVSALIVEDPDGYLPTQIANAEEIIFLCHELNSESLNRIATDSKDDVFTISGANNNSPTITVNGEVGPTFSITTGAWIRIRIIWAAWTEDTLSLNLEIPNCDVQLLAKDGIYIADYPRAISRAKVPPGGRADVMVRCPDISTQYDVNGLYGKLATLETTATYSETDVLEPWTPDFPAYLADLRNMNSDSECTCETRLDGSIDGEEPAVNGLPYSPDNGFLHESYLGAIVERDVNTDDGEHPYHQHVYPFQLISGSNDEYYHTGDWHDTILENFIVRYQPIEYESKVMIHCHVLEHEDLGMMAKEYVSTDGTCVCTAPGGGQDELDWYWILLICIISFLVLIACFVAYKHYKNSKTTINTSV